MIAEELEILTLYGAYNGIVKSSENKQLHMTSRTGVKRRIKKMVPFI
jgi:hypothetical protein